MEAIEKYLLENNYPKFRLTQFNKGYYQDLDSTVNDIFTLPKDLRELLTKNFPPILSYKEGNNLVVNSIQYGSYKSGLLTTDRLLIESVLICDNDRYTVCVSTEVGCPIGCAFCATGQLGFTRNLTTDEIVEQVLHFARQLKKQNKKVTNVVFMGMGEPLLNFENVIKSIEILTDPNKFGLSQRNIVLSTVGIISKLNDLFAEKHQFRIAISLHASNQILREKLIPIAKQNPIDELLSIAKQYSSKFNKRVSYEYVLLKNVNDTEENAKELVNLFKENKHLTFINLIKFNRTNTKDKFEMSELNSTTKFANILKNAGIPTYIRYSAGEEINAACGQLAGNYNSTQSS